MAIVSDFITAHAGLTLPWYQTLLTTAVEPNLLPISVAVVFAQLAVGASLLTGRLVPMGLVVGVFLNLNFVAAGAVNPSIFYLICQAALLLWMIQTAHARGVVARWFRWIPTASLLFALADLPFVSTLDPADVIEDPAMVLVVFALLIAMSSWAGGHNATTAAHERTLPAS